MLARARSASIFVSTVKTAMPASIAGVDRDIDVGQGLDWAKPLMNALSLEDRLPFGHVPLLGCLLAGSVF
jgi:hypothetical protein